MHFKLALRVISFAFLFFFAACDNFYGLKEFDGGSVSLSDGEVYAFADTTVGLTREKTFTLTNGGPDDLYRFEALSLSAPFQFKGGTYPGTGGTCGSNLTAGQSCTIVIVASPTASGTFGETLTLSYLNGSETSFQITRSMTVRGLSVASLSISDGSTYNYGRVVKAQSSDKSFTITNSGDSTATSLSPSVGGAPFSLPGTGTCGTTLSGGATCTLVVRYTPTAYTTSSDTLTLTYSDAVNNQQTTRSFTGQGVGAPGTIDTTFVSNGRVTTSNLGFSRDEEVAHLLSADGTKIYAAVNVTLGTTSFPMVVRRISIAPLALDTSFMTNGMSKLTTLAYTAGLLGQAGPYIYLGVPGSMYSFVRLLSDGQLDTSFGSCGSNYPARGISNGSAGVMNPFIYVTTSAMALYDGTCTTDSITTATTLSPSGVVGESIYHTKFIDLGGGAIRVLASWDCSAGSMGGCLRLTRNKSDGTYDTAFNTNGIYGANITVTSSGISRGVTADTAGNVYWAYSLDDVEKYEQINSNGVNVVTNTVAGSGAMTGAIASIDVQTDGTVSILKKTGTCCSYQIMDYNSGGVLTNSLTQSFATATSIVYPQTIVHNTAGERIGLGYAVSTSGNRDSLYFRTDITLTDRVILSSDYLTADSLGRNSAIDSSGKMVVSALTYMGYEYKVALLRYNTDGGLDTSFNSNGIVYTTLGTGTITTAGMPISLTSTGSIYLVHDQGISRFKTNGTFDTSFRTTGTYIYPSFAIDQQSDGKLLAATSQTTGLVVIRLTTSGVLDTTFHTDGLAAAFALTTAGAQFVRVLSDGKILGVGYGTAAAEGYALARFLTDGSLDATFATAGQALTTFAAGSKAKKWAPYGDLINVTGNIDSSGFGFVRYRSSGALDTSFYTSGRVRHSFGAGTAAIRDMFLDTDGGVLLLGGLNTANPWAGIRVKSDGTLDTQFGTAGRFRAGIGTTGDIPASISVDTDGKYIISGSTWNGLTSDLAIIRIWP